MKNKFYTYIQYFDDYQYIGKGSDIRYLDILSHKKNNKLYKKISKKYKMKSEIIDWFDNEDNAYDAEIDLIALQKSRGIKLLNGDKGGVGGKERKDTEETRKKKSKAQMGKKFKVSTLKKMSKAKKGKKKSTSHKFNMSLGMLNLPKLKCPHCNKIGGYTGMKRWHFDKCKF